MIVSQSVVSGSYVQDLQREFCDMQDTNTKRLIIYSI